MIILNSDSRLFEYPHQNSMLSHYQDNGFGEHHYNYNAATDRQAVKFVYEGLDDFYDEEEECTPVENNNDLIILW